MPDESMLLWGEFLPHPLQNIYYVHGALHLIEYHQGLRKLRNSVDKKSILEQIRGVMKSDSFPVFVAEGKSKDKMAAIRRNSYLNHCFKKLATIDGALFIFGSSLPEQDDHVWNAIKIVLYCRPGYRVSDCLTSK